MPDTHLDVGDLGGYSFIIDSHQNRPGASGVQTLFLYSETG